jgi:hypothetical protein
MDLALLALHYMIILTLLLGLVFTLGIIWRTEKKLDISYKFTFVALLGFLASRVIALGYFFPVEFRDVVIVGLDFVGTFFLLLSILEMRDIVRILDKEKKESI